MTAAWPARKAATAGVCAAWVARDDGAGARDDGAGAAAGAGAGGASYRVVARVLSGYAEAGATLADALYRFAVLLGLPGGGGGGGGGGGDAAGAPAPFAADNPVWAVLRAACVDPTAAPPAPGDAPPAGARAGKGAKAAKGARGASAPAVPPPGSVLLISAADAEACRRQFRADRAVAGLDSGSHPLLARARRRAAALQAPCEAAAPGTAGAAEVERCCFLRGLVARGLLA